MWFILDFDSINFKDYLGSVYVVKTFENYLVGVVALEARVDYIVEAE